jgi:hypothetical protein
MVQSVNDVANTLNANYKQVYAEDIQFVIPEGVKLIKDIKFVEAEMQQGGFYNQPLALALEHGMTYAAGDVAANLNNAVAGQLQNAIVTGYQMIMRAQLSYAAASRSAKGKNVFRQGAGLVLEQMLLGHKKRAEAAAWYGQRGLGIVNTVTPGSGSTAVLNLTAAEWGDALWVGMVNAPLDVYIGTTSGIRQSCNLTAIDPINRNLTVDVVGAIAAGDTLYFKGAFGNEMLGVHQVLTQTGGTLFNINQLTYPDLWQGTAYSAGSAQLGYQKIVKACAKALPKGGEGRFKAYVHPESYQDVINEPQLAMTSDTKNWTPALTERGADAIKFHCVTGVVEIVPCTYVKRGYAYGLLQDGCWVRIGSADVGPTIPGLQGDGEVFLHMPNTSGIEMRSFSDFAPFCDKVGAQWVINNIVPTT